MTFATPAVISEPPPLIPSLPSSMHPVSLNWTPIPHIGVGAGSSNVLSGGNPFTLLEDWQPMSWGIPLAER